MQNLRSIKEKRNNFILGDALRVLKTLPSNSIDAIIFSPPYYKKRDYGHKQQWGQETTSQEYLEKLVMFCAYCYRVLKPTGNLLINIDDKYNTSCNAAGGKRHSKGFKRSSAIKEVPYKSLFGIPQRFVAMMLLHPCKWIYREDIIWHKPNPMTESVKNRCTRAHEPIFHFTKTDKYYWGKKEIETETKGSGHDLRSRVSRKRFPTQLVNGMRKSGYYPTANARSVWRIPVQPSKIKYYAKMPDEVARRLVLAGCPKDGLILDPFCGVGTTCVQAIKHGRNFIGVDLVKESIQIAKELCTPYLNQLKLF